MDVWTVREPVLGWLACALVSVVSITVYNGALAAAALYLLCAKGRSAQEPARRRGREVREDHEQDAVRQLPYTFREEPRAARRP